MAEVKLKKKPTKMEDMTKEQIRQAILKKRECNAKALAIVESLLEKGVTESYFLQCLQDINQNHLDDIIEERSITHLCGYPICSKTISEQEIPKQQYRISLKTNKVYDITARKSFCSNSCYKSAMYIKKQMLTSPLWFREYEDIPDFHLLPLDSIGSLGQEIDVALIERIGTKTNKQLFTSINEFTSASLNEMNDSKDKDASNEVNKTGGSNENRPIIPTNRKQIATTPESPIKENTENLKTDENQSLNSSVNNDFSIQQTIEISNPNVGRNPETQASISNIQTHADDKKKITKQKPMSNPLNIIGEIVEKPEHRIDPIISNTPNEAKPRTPTNKIPQKKKPSMAVVTIEVEKCLAEWFTLDTLLFLFGEEKVREIVADKGECIKEYLNNYAKGIFYSSNSYDQYQALCRKLNMLEMEDKKYDAQTLQRETRPLPDYSILQEESKKMQLKVKAFLAGATEVPELKLEEIPKSSEEENVTQLPLVDKNAQNALRRRIVCQHLNKVLPDLLRSLGLLTLSISSDVRLIVNTFKLKADNIMFKPIQWNLIAIVLIKLLSIRDKRLEYLLEQPMAYQHMQLLLLSYKQDGGYLHRLILWLTDIDRLLDTNDTQFTIE